MSWLRVGRLTDLPDGGGVRIDVGEEQIAVFRIGEEVYALGDVCSHAEASLSEGELFGTEVECPRHGSSFDLLTGQPRSLPATKPVPVYATKIEGGEVFVSVEEA